MFSERKFEKSEPAAWLSTPHPLLLWGAVVIAITQSVCMSALGLQVVCVSRAAAICIVNRMWQALPVLSVLGQFVVTRHIPESWSWEGRLLTGLFISHESHSNIMSLSFFPDVLILSISGLFPSPILTPFPLSHMHIK